MVGQPPRGGVAVIDAELAGDLLGTQVSVHQPQTFPLTRRQELDGIFGHFLCSPIRWEVNGPGGASSSRNGEAAAVSLMQQAFATPGRRRETTAHPRQEVAVPPERAPVHRLTAR